MNVVRALCDNSQRRYEQLDSRFEPEMGVYWAIMKPEPRPSFGATLLLDLHAFIEGIIQSRGQTIHNGEAHNIN